jgi:hypothetical protein
MVHFETAFNSFVREGCYFFYFVHCSGNSDPLRSFNLHRRNPHRKSTLQSSIDPVRYRSNRRMS